MKILKTSVCQRKLIGRDAVHRVRPGVSVADAQQRVPTGLSKENTHHFTCFRNFKLCGICCAAVGDSSSMK